jgi:hypothetical protein
MAGAILSMGLGAIFVLVGGCVAAADLIAKTQGNKTSSKVVLGVAVLLLLPMLAILSPVLSLLSGH